MARGGCGLSGAGQRLLGGMGELHLEVTRDRLNTTFKLAVELGR